MGVVEEGGAAAGVHLLCGGVVSTVQCSAVQYSTVKYGKGITQLRRHAAEAPPHRAQLLGQVQLGPRPERGLGPHHGRDGRHRQPLHQQRNEEEHLDTEILGQGELLGAVHILRKHFYCL